MYTFLLVGIGGFFGAIFRYLLSSWIQNNGPNFPVGTLSVNFIGSLCLSLVVFSSESTGFFTEDTRIFLSIGLLGAFTTMSAFSYETFKFIEQKAFFEVSLNIIGTIILTLFAIYLGKIIVLNLLKP